jgi:hypothetical protein
MAESSNVRIVAIATQGVEESELVEPVRRCGKAERRSTSYRLMVSRCKR